MLRYLVISDRSLPTSLSNAWKAMDIVLLGPITAAAVEAFDLGGHDGAIVDLEYEGGEMIACVEKLDLGQIPFVFAAFVSSSLKPPGCFVLSEAKEEIWAIYNRLGQSFQKY